MKHFITFTLLLIAATQSALAVPFTKKEDVVPGLYVGLRLRDAQNIAQPGVALVRSPLKLGPCLSVARANSPFLGAPEKNQQGRLEMLPSSRCP